LGLTASKTGGVIGCWLEPSRPISHTWEAMPLAPKRVNATWLVWGLTATLKSIASCVPVLKWVSARMCVPLARIR
jgi:hypothetical protein